MIHGNDESKDVRDQINSFVKNLGGIFDLVGDIVAKGENIRKLGGEIDTPLGGKNFKTSYDVTMKLGLNDLGEAKERVANSIPFRKKVEPEVDIYDEENEYRIIILAGNIDEEDIKICKKDNSVAFEAKNQYIFYSKEISIPYEFNPEDIKWSYKNGIVNICLKR